MAADRAIDGPVTRRSASGGGEVGHTPSLFPTRLMLKKPIDKPLEHTSTRLFASPTEHKKNTSVFGSSLPGIQSPLASSDGAHATSAPMGKLSSFLTKGSGKATKNILVFCHIPHRTCDI